MNVLQRCVFSCCLLAPCLAWSHGPHEHGAVRLDIGVDAGTLTLQLESPLDNLLGFERAPRNGAERAAAAAAVATLKAAATLFRIDPAAGCTPAAVSLNSAALGLGAPEPGAQAGHADIDGSFEFRCSNAGRAAFVDVGLFAAFARIQRIDVQVALATGQFKRTLKRPAQRVALKP